MNWIYLFNINYRVVLFCFNVIKMFSLLDWARVYIFCIKFKLCDRAKNDWAVQG